MSGNGLRRLWRQLFPPDASAPPGAVRPGTGASGPAGIEAGARPAPPRRHTAPPRDDDPQREAHLGAVLEALRTGPLPRDRLAGRVGAAGWGPGRLDAVVAHGVATGVLLTEGDTVRARYAD